MTNKHTENISKNKNINRKYTANIVQWTMMWSQVIISHKCYPINILKIVLHRLATHIDKCKNGDFYWKLQKIWQARRPAYLTWPVPVPGIFLFVSIFLSIVLWAKKSFDICLNFGTESTKILKNNRFFSRGLIAFIFLMME